MTKNVAAAMMGFGFLLMFGAVGGMENPAMADYFAEQLLTALAGIGLAGCGALALAAAEARGE
jgi:hypothetical protein